MKELIGLRTIKTGIAVFLSVIVSNLLHLEYTFFVCMTAIVSMDKTAKLSLKMGRNRVVGTLCGALLGICFNYIDAGNAFLCGLGIIILITFLNKCKIPGAIPISGIVFSAVMVHLGAKSPILYGFHRTLDSLIGASITFVVNLAILPYYNVNKLDKILSKLENELLTLKDEIQLGTDFDLAPIIATSDKIAFTLDMYMSEFMPPKSRHKIFELCAQYSILKEMIDQYSAIHNINDDQYVFDYHINKINQTYDLYKSLQS